MCGFAGVLRCAARKSSQLMDEIASMNRRLTHRGPDGEGIWCDYAGEVALGHCRLAILDLSEHGHQPMFSDCGRYVVAYNGEIYNHDEIRRALEQEGCAPRWRGHSDTEVLLAAISCWGLERALKESIGMFAFALWDIRDRILTLARDRAGEKPLYYGWNGGALRFASELKALAAGQGWRGAVDKGALALYLRYSYIPAPWSIYEGIYKLLPGTFLRIGRKDLQQMQSGGPPPTPVPYWSMRGAVEEGVRERFAGTQSEAADTLDHLLRTAVGRQMVADVPLGAFLSGGIDSSTIVALMQAQSIRPVKTFTIGFGEDGYQEAPYAAAVAKHIGTDHLEMTVTPRDALDVLPVLPSLFDEPFADPSQIPTFLVSRLTRDHVTVSLSGDGGDELFGGYNRYFLARKIAAKTAPLPHVARRYAAALLRRTPGGLLDRALGGLAAREINRYGHTDRVSSKLRKLGEIFDAQTDRELYLRLISSWKDPARLVRDGAEPLTAMSDAASWPVFDDYESWMMYIDSVGYLPDNILVKVDRAAMGISLETRIPLLDHRIIEFAWSLPGTMKIREGQGKWLLRQVLDRYVPKSLIERPKMGFAVPIAEWLRGPLREWASDLLSERRLREEGFFVPAPVVRLWREHLEGRGNHAAALWIILMFQSWWGENQEQSAHRHSRPYFRIGGPCPSPAFN